MANLGFYFNSDRCIGCRACQIACKDKNDLAVGVLYRQVRSYETGSFPTPGYYHHSSTCNHCAVPACLAVCPVSAISKDEETGIVLIDADICTGCRQCETACPYGIPQFIEEKGIDGKCDFCLDLQKKGENPVCVDACPQRVLEWGDIDELIATHPKAVKDLPILPDSTMTNSSTIITPREAGLKADFRQKII
jgi:anaerobic dimethyl sulfoxide reductase subunit B (iron-sulfur subunit)